MCRTVVSAPGGAVAAPLESMFAETLVRGEGNGHHGHPAGTGPAGGARRQGRRDDRPHRAGEGGPRVGPQPGGGRPGRRAVRRGQPGERLPRAEAARRRQRGHAEDAEAQGGRPLPRGAPGALLPHRPGDGRLRARGLRPGPLRQEDGGGRRHRDRLRGGGPRRLVGPGCADEEIRRRARAVSVLPPAGAMGRLVGSALTGVDEEWMSMGFIDAASLSGGSGPRGPTRSPRRRSRRGRA